MVLCGIAVFCMKSSRCHSWWNKLEVRLSQENNGCVSVLFLRSQFPTEKSWCYKYHICIAENAPAKFTMQALELAPTKLHDRSPIFLGSYDDVEEIKALYASESNNAWFFCLRTRVEIKALYAWESTAWSLNYNKRVVKKSTAWSFCQRTRASFTRVDIHIVTVLIRYLLCSYIVLKNPLYGRARYSSIVNTGLSSSQIYMLSWFLDTNLDSCKEGVYVKTYYLCSLSPTKDNKTKTLCSYAWFLVLEVLFIIRFVMLQPSFTLI